ncbi:penicillin-binding protein 1C [Chitinophagaceae bacterium MMS25-I14]
MKKRLIKITKWSLTSLVSAVALFFILDLVFPLHTDVEYAPIILARDGTVLHAYITRDQQWRMNARLDEITPQLKEAIVFKEDKHFYHHWGVNPLAIGRAIVNNIFHLKRTSGASTITMQVARMLHRKPRTYGNKVVEMFRALQLEKNYNKEEILQLYLNLVPYGSNIQGVKAASLLYFNKTPDQLSLAELTALSIIPNRPNSLVMGKDNDRIVAARNIWLQRFREAHLFSEAQIQDAIHEPLTAHRHDAPNGAPQFAWRMRRSQPSATEIHTTADAAIQQKAEDIVHNYSRILGLHNIYNASVFIVDNNTHQVLCYVGSPDFTDRYHQGEVDGVKAIRSPGSALKPLLYGLAFDHGIVTPKTIIADVPVNFKGYAPENYDLAFHGEVSMEDALRQSLNIPAVKTLNELGVPVFTEKMVQAGFSAIWRDRKKMGLSMILGGCGVRLDEMTTLYSSFSNDGQYIPLQWTLPDSVWHDHKKYRPVQKGFEILSPASAYMITQVLSELHRPDLPNLSEGAGNVPHIAWKTGTSYGRKDGWSIGYNKRYTIGVWTGNFSGAGVADLSGAGTATPLLFQLFNAIDRNAGKDWLQAPPDLAFRFVCAKTGKLPNECCTEQVMDYYIPGISKNDICDHMKEVWLSADEKFSYCTSCLPPAGYKTKLYPNVSPEMAAYNNTHHIVYEKIPPHNPSCTRTFEGQAPVINSLQGGLTYLITDRGKQQLQLSCATANDVQTVYWYINDHFFQMSKPGEKLFFAPEDPSVKISCTDDKGRNSNITVKIKFI